MIVRLSFLIAAASIATYAVKQINFKSWMPEDILCKNKKEDDEEHLICSDHGLKLEVLEEKEEVKLINNIIINPTSSSPMFFEDKYDTSSNTKEEKDIKVSEIEMANNANELKRLHNLVQELEERKVNLEMELLEYRRAKEKETSTMTELQWQLEIKTAEIDMLKTNITSLQFERKKLQEEEFLARKELEKARNKIKGLQTQFELEVNQTKAQILVLKQQVSRIQEKEKEKFKTMKDLEVEVMELKRNNKELQHEKRELILKLDASESKLKALFAMRDVKV